MRCAGVFGQLAKEYAEARAAEDTSTGDTVSLVSGLLEGDSEPAHSAVYDGAGRQAAARARGGSRWVC